MKKPTIIDLARAAGVSPTTVSHAFSGKRHVDADTRDGIMRAARKMGYHPNSAAQALRSGRTDIVAIATCVPMSVAAGPSRLGFLMEIAASAAVSAFASGLTLCLIPPLQRGVRPGAVPADGVILIEPAEGDPLIAWFEDRHIPIASIGKAPGRPDIPAVDLQSAAMAEMLLNHLRDAGGRQIALITGTARRTSYLQAEGAYRTFVARHGMAEIILQLDEDQGEPLARMRGRDLLRAHPGIDAVLAPVDAFATGILAAARDLGRDVPGDLRVATRYDGLRAKLARPPLTAVDLRLAEIAEQAVDLLLDLVQGTPRQERAPVATLIARDSTYRDR